MFEEKCKKKKKKKNTHPSEPRVPGAPDDLEHPLESVDDGDVERPAPEVDDEDRVVVEGPRRRLLLLLLRALPRCRRRDFGERLRRGGRPVRSGARGAQAVGYCRGDGLCRCFFLCVREREKDEKKGEKGRRRRRKKTEGKKM